MLNPNRSATLLAVSGGADSIALALAMWSHGLPIAIAHIVHDMRDRSQTAADRDFVESFARERAIPFHCLEINARERGGNLEAASRTLRYRALVDIAAHNGLRFVATAHHARDQAETSLMRLLRGAGTRGIGAMPRKRSLSRTHGIALIRPALDLHPDQLLAINREAGIEWRDDPTNRDTTLLRARVRHELLPLLEQISPGAIARICSAAERCREDSGAIRALAMALESSGTREGDAIMFPREFLRAQPPAAIGELLRSLAMRIDSATRDHLGARVITPAVRAIRDRKQHERVFSIGKLECHLNASRILMRPVPDSTP